jgi:large subunit ribosomal protein L23
MIDLVKYIITEKSYRLIEKNQYTFDVDPRLTKPQIKKVFENLFQVNVLAVNTHLPPVEKNDLEDSKVIKRYKRVILPLNQIKRSLFWRQVLN